MALATCYGTWPGLDFVRVVDRQGIGDLCSRGSRDAIDDDFKPLLLWRQLLKLTDDILGYDLGGPPIHNHPSDAGGASVLETVPGVYFLDRRKLVQNEIEDRLIDIGPDRVGRD